MALKLNLELDKEKTHTHTQRERERERKTRGRGIREGQEATGSSGRERVEMGLRWFDETCHPISVQYQSSAWLVRHFPLFSSLR
jgi:hypothetical protein